jgi:hypothetical protein
MTDDSATEQFNQILALRILIILLLDFDFLLTSTSEIWISIKFFPKSKSRQDAGAKLTWVINHSYHTVCNS